MSFNADLLNLPVYTEITAFLYFSPLKAAYFGLLVYLAFAALLCSLLVTLAYIFSLSLSQDSEKRSEYECGFEPFDSATRLPFDIHFYLVGILFLIFDVEIALLFPWAFALRFCGWFGFYLIWAFVAVLGAGFFYEWKRGALIWPSRQYEQPYGYESQSSLSVFASGLIIGAIEHEYAYATNVYAKLLLTNFAPELLLSLALTGLTAYLGYTHANTSFNPKVANHVAIFLNHVFALMIIMYFFLSFFTTPHIFFNQAFVASQYVYFFKGLTTITVFIIFTTLDKTFKEEKRPAVELPLLMGLGLFFMLILLSANNLFIFVFSIVGFSLSLYVLSLLYGWKSAVSREAGAKYFFLSAFSTGLLFFGLILLFQSFRTLDLHAIFFMLQEQLMSRQPGRTLPAVACVFLLFGLLFKLAAFPCHLWVAEVYDGLPAPVLAYFVLPVKVSLIAAILSVSYVFSFYSVWNAILGLSGLMSMIWGAFAAVYETKTRRFLAYAALNQMGFFLIGLALHTSNGNFAVLIFLFFYVLSNVVFFVVFLLARRVDGQQLIYLTDFRRLALEDWWASAAIAVSFFSQAGLPFFAGFFTKYYLLLAAGQEEQWSFIVIGLLSSLFSTYYYLRIAKIFWFESNSAARSVVCNFSGFQKIVVFVCVIIICFFGFSSSEFVSFFQHLAVEEGTLVFAALLITPSRGFYVLESKLFLHWNANRNASSFVSRIKYTTSGLFLSLKTEKEWTALFCAFSFLIYFLFFVFIHLFFLYIIIHALFELVFAQMCSGQSEHIASKISTDLRVCVASSATEALPSSFEQKHTSLLRNGYPYSKSTLPRVGYSCLSLPPLPHFSLDLSVKEFCDARREISYRDILVSRPRELLNFETAGALHDAAVASREAKRPLFQQLLIQANETVVPAERLQSHEDAKKGLELMIEQLDKDYDTTLQNLNRAQAQAHIVLSEQSKQNQITGRFDYKVYLDLKAELAHKKFAAWCNNQKK